MLNLFLFFDDATVFGSHTVNRIQFAYPLPYRRVDANANASRLRMFTKSSVRGSRLEKGECVGRDSESIDV
jgi:hypothetical protein